LATPTTCVERLCPLAAAAALTLLLCGCGGHRQAQPTLLQRGRAVFAAACAGCHTLTGHDTHVPGGDLAIARLSVDDIASFVRVMPVHLSTADVEAVAAYVHEAAKRSSR
jgi:mono/diheme cytochrome c family protein